MKLLQTHGPYWISLYWISLYCLGSPLSWIVGVDGDAVEATMAATVASSVTSSFCSSCGYDSTWGSVHLVLETSSSGCAQNWSMHWIFHTEISVGIRRKHWRTWDTILKPKCGILCFMVDLWGNWPFIKDNLRSITLKCNHHCLTWFI